MDAHLYIVNYYEISFFFNDTATTEIYTLSLHDALPICFTNWLCGGGIKGGVSHGPSDEWGYKPLDRENATRVYDRSEEHTSELQSRQYLVCRLLLEKKICRPRLDKYNSIHIQTQPSSLL